MNDETEPRRGSRAVPAGTQGPGEMAEAFRSLRMDTESMIARSIAGTGADPADAAAALESLRVASEELRTVEEELWRQRDALVAEGEFGDERLPPARALFSEAPFPYLVTTGTGVILLANAAAGALFGYRPESLHDRPLAGIATNPAGAVRQLARTALANDRQVTAAVWVRAAGRKQVRLRATVARRSGLHGTDPVLLWVLHPIPSASPIPVVEPETDGEPSDEAHESKADNAEPLDTTDGQPRVSASLLRLASRPLTDQVEESLGQVAEAIGHAVYADGASITDLRPPELGATSDRVRLADQIQYDKQQGPCVAAMRTRHVQVERNLASHPDESAGGLMHADCGFRSVAAVPLISADELLGALNLYAEAPDAFDEDKMATACMLARPAAASLLNIKTYRDARAVATELRTAMDSRATIEQAKGVLMADHGLDADEAFNVLTRYSQERNRKLRLVADDVIATTLEDSDS